MIRVTIELISANTGKTTVLGRMNITNDGTGTKKRGNYNGMLWRHMGKGHSRAGRTGRVENFPRESYVVWRLIYRMLRAMFPEEK